MNITPRQTKPLFGQLLHWACLAGFLTILVICVSCSKSDLTSPQSPDAGEAAKESEKVL